MNILPGLEAIQIDAGRQRIAGSVCGVPINAILTGAFCLTHEILHDLAEDVEDIEFNSAPYRDCEFDGCEWIEGVGVVLLQDI